MAQCYSSSITDIQKTDTTQVGFHYADCKLLLKILLIFTVIDQIGFQ